MMFKQKVLRTIEKYNLINKNDNILVALSGGADSVSLLLVLLEIKEQFSLEIEAAHINHSIREEADSDMEFVKKLCKEKNVKIHTLKENIIDLSHKWGYSEEKTGRIVRYNFFGKITKGRNMKVATAHTKDDCAENFLICALRGTSPKGIPPKRDNVVRPLIEVTKDEIYDYLKENKQAFVEDKTNFVADYTRNKIRLEIIPYINEKFHTKFANNVYNSLDVSYFEDDYLSLETKKQINDICVFKSDCAQIDANKFSALHIALKRRILKEIYYQFVLQDGYVSFEQISAILKICEKKETGKKIELPKSIEAIFSYDKIIFKRKTESENEDFEYKVKLNEKIYVPCLDKTVFINDLGKGTEFYSEDNEFILRNRRPKDKIYIEKVGHKKLKNYFIDKKIPQKERNSLIIVSDSLGIAYVQKIYRRKNNLNNKIYVYIGE